MAEKPREIPAYDPYKGYEIRSLNKKFEGESKGVRFVKGVALLHPLPTSADEEDFEERLDTLMWFWNTNPERRKVPIDPSDPNSDSEWQDFPGYVITEWDGTSGPKSDKKRRQPVTA